MLNIVYIVRLEFLSLIRTNSLASKQDCVGGLLKSVKHFSSKFVKKWTSYFYKLRFLA